MILPHQTLSYLVIFQIECVNFQQFTLAAAKYTSEGPSLTSTPAFLLLLICWQMRFPVLVVLSPFSSPHLSFLDANNDSTNSSPNLYRVNESEADSRFLKMII